MLAPMYPEDVRFEHRSGASIAIGRFTYGWTDDTFHAQQPTEEITVGRYTSIAANVGIFGGDEHLPDVVTTYPLRTLMLRPTDTGNWDGWGRGPTSVGHDVWLGRGAMVLSGVTVGHGAILGAGAVVTRDVPPYAVAVGNPATVVRRRVEPELAERLLAIAWWDWELERIEAAELYFEADPAVFAEAAERGVI
jgi:acetyltransferase-like isoleucine patch superfamily enzyme